MRPLLHTEFAALLARADLSQARFARLAGVTPRQVNNWARGRAAVPRWAAVLAIALEERSAEELDLRLEETRFSCHELLGVAANADVAATHRAMARLALIYHPDKGGSPEQMAAVNAASAEALDASHARAGHDQPVARTRSQIRLSPQSLGRVASIRERDTGRRSRPE